MAQGTRKTNLDPNNLNADTVRDAMTLLMDPKMLPVLLEVMVERGKQGEYRGVDNGRESSEGEAEWMSLLYERVSKAHLSYEGQGTPGKSFRDRMIELAAMSLAAVECLDRGRF